MSASRLALIRRKLRHLTGISARRVAIRVEAPWYWRAALWVLILTVSATLAVALYDAGRRFAGFDSRTTHQQIAALEDQLAAAEKELVGLRSVARSADVSIQVEKSAQEQLADQLRSLQRENAALKEELAVFEGFVSGAVVQATGLRIVRVALEPLGDRTGRYRYRVLIVNRQPARGVQEVRGDLQFDLIVSREGKDATIKFPGGDQVEAARYKVLVKHFHRAEGEFVVPAGAVVKGGEVRLLQDGQVRARQEIAF